MLSGNHVDPDVSLDDAAAQTAALIDEDLAALVSNARINAADRTLRQL